MPDDPINEAFQKAYKSEVVPRVEEVVNTLNEITDDHIRHKFLTTTILALLRGVKVCDIEKLGALEMARISYEDDVE